MKCEKVQDLLKTDYIDGEADERMRENIRAHLAICAECRGIEEALKKSAIGPFRQAERKRPPEFVWERIKERITREGDSVPQRKFIKILKPAFTVPVVALAIMVFAIIHYLPLGSPSGVESYMEEEIEYLITLGTNGASENGLGTSIEEYLLF